MENRIVYSLTLHPSKNEQTPPSFEILFLVVVLMMGVNIGSQCLFRL